jgi:hypothetical protein
VPAGRSLALLSWERSMLKKFSSRSYYDNKWKKLIDGSSSQWSGEKKRVKVFQTLKSVNFEAMDLRQDYDLPNVSFANAIFNAVREWYVHAARQMLVLKYAKKHRLLSKNKILKYSDNTLFQNQRFVSNGRFESMHPSRNLVFEDMSLPAYLFSSVDEMGKLPTTLVRLGELEPREEYEPMIVPVSALLLEGAVVPGPVIFNKVIDSGREKKSGPKIIGLMNQYIQENENPDLLDQILTEIMLEIRNSGINTTVSLSFMQDLKLDPNEKNKPIVHVGQTHHDPQTIREFCQIANYALQKINPEDIKKEIMGGGIFDVLMSQIQGSDVDFGKVVLPSDNFVYPQITVPKNKKH